MMERWESRYTHSRSRAAQMVEHSRKERVKTTLIIVLFVLLVGMSIAGVQAMIFRGEGADVIITRMRAESSDAVGLAVNLSRYGGSDTAAILGRIRADVHALEVLNDLHHTLYGSRCVDGSHFTLLYAAIDGYSDKLKNGTTSLEELNTLVSELNTLDAQIQALK